MAENCFDAQTDANGHAYVDLGLPSGTLWTTCNIGATKPEEYGDYFAWGETSTKDTYDWTTYKYSKGDEDELTKYCDDSDYGYNYGYNGFTDSLNTLEPSDDAATVNWGSGWQTPSDEQWEELLANTTNKWTMQNGVKGLLFTSKKNSETLFLPAAGCRWDDEFDDVGSYGSYWSSSRHTDYSDDAWYFFFASYNCFLHCFVENDSRCEGRSVRAVRSVCQN